MKGFRRVILGGFLKRNLIFFLIFFSFFRAFAVEEGSFPTEAQARKSFCHKLSEGTLKGGMSVILGIPAAISHRIMPLRSYESAVSIPLTFSLASGFLSSYIGASCCFCKGEESSRHPNRSTCCRLIYLLGATVFDLILILPSTLGVTYLIQEGDGNCSHINLEEADCYHDVFPDIGFSGIGVNFVTLVLAGAFRGVGQYLQDSPRDCPSRLRSWTRRVFSCFERRRGVRTVMTGSVEEVY